MKNAAHKIERNAMVSFPYQRGNPKERLLLTHFFFNLIRSRKSEKLHKGNTFLHVQNYLSLEIVLGTGRYTQCIFFFFVE